MLKKICLSLIVLFSLSHVCSAQSDTVHLKLKDSEKKTIITDRPPQAIYFQLGGAGPILSGIYDRRFGKRVNGAGFSAGIGYWGESGLSVFSIPVSLNYLIGRDTHFLEVAAGATFLTASLDLFGDTESGSGVFEHINIGYRYQPTKGGFFFRGGVSPLFFQGDYVTSYYIGFGHNF